MDEILLNLPRDNVDQVLERDLAEIVGRITVMEKTRGSLFLAIKGFLEESRAGKII